METDAQPNGTALTHRQILVVFSGLMLGLLLAALDQTIVATALPTIVGELGGLDHLSWVVTAYLLTSTASTPLFGKLSDLYGRKVLFQGAIAIFLVGSVLSGLSQSMGQLIAFRAVQGIGAGGLIALSMAIVGDVVSPRERGRYQGYIGSVFALASVAGPLAGGFFVDHLSWRWVFYVNVPVGLVALAVTGVVLRLPFHRRPHAIDYAGAALLVAAVSSILLVTVWGGNEYPWGSSPILGLGAAGAVLLALFVLRERRAPEPLLPLRLFRNRVFTVGAAASFVVGFSMFGAIVFVPLYLQVVSGTSPTRSGLLLTPLMFGVIVSSVVSGRLITRLGRYRMFPIAGTATTAAGLFLLSRLQVGSPPALSAAFTAVVGLGLGMVLQVLVLAVQNVVDHRDLGTATSAMSFFRSMGGAFGVAVFGSILSAGLSRHLEGVLRTAGSLGLDPRTLRSAPASIRALPPPVRDAVVDAFARSLHSVFLWAVPVAVLGFLVALFLEEVPLGDHAHVLMAAEGAVAVDEGVAARAGTR